MIPEGGRRRVLVEGASPEIDAGRYPAKRVIGDAVIAECDFVADGHDVLAGRVLYRRAEDAGWHGVALAPLANDRWRASFIVNALGRWEFTFEAWVDPFATWCAGTTKKRRAGQDVSLELLAGAQLLAEGASRASDDVTRGLLDGAARRTADTRSAIDDRLVAATNGDVTRAMRTVPDLANATRYDRILSVVVDPPLARFSSWYELFPRSCGEAGRHGTFRDVEARLEYVARLGFDVLYLPPIHPIGRAFRKGPNNALTAGPNDPGSPWAIGAAEGGHKAVHPELGTLDDFKRLVDTARARGIAVAMDIAFQASPDHPYVDEHPEWFLRRPDGTIQYAENPPKKYQDVYPFDFECTEWRALWNELLSVFSFWVAHGVRVFRVDNPHTKALRFWEWCIAEIKSQHPDVIFLAEAFTRPKLMYALAKGGFTQSYTYFTWRHTKHEFEAYLRELTTGKVADFNRPNFWPNTPDILPEHLQFGGRPTFLLRLILAATLSSNYGIYGPAFELMEHVARSGAEEYVDNEKFQLRSWNLADPKTLADVVALVNRVRRENVALQQTNDIAFHVTTDEALLAYSKRSDDGANVVLVVANLDPGHRRGGHVELDLGAMGIGQGESFQMHDLLSELRSLWTGSKNYVEFDPATFPASIYVVRRKVRTEADFEYFL